MLAGVTIVDPADDRDRCRRADRTGHRDRSVLEPSRLHRDRRRRAGRPALDPDRHARRGRREHRPLLPQGRRRRRRASVGPFAYLRPGAVLRAGSKAGTFVEIKNSDIGAGTRCPTCPTSATPTSARAPTSAPARSRPTTTARTSTAPRSASGAFVSVDTMFVAPVSLGDGAYTGAGSVITEDVPPGALGIARARQKNLAGYTERRKQRDSGSPHADGSDKNVPESTGPGSSEATESDPRTSSSETTIRHPSTLHSNCDEQPA